MKNNCKYCGKTLVDDEPCLCRAVPLVDGALGVYLPQAFAKRFLAADATDVIDLAALLAGPVINEGEEDQTWNDGYWPAWDAVLDNVRLSLGNQACALHYGPSGGLFALPVD